MPRTLGRPWSSPCFWSRLWISVPMDMDPGNRHHGVHDTAGTHRTTLQILWGRHGAMLQENIQYLPQLIEINPYELHPSASSVDPWKQGRILLVGTQWLCVVLCRWEWEALLWSKLSMVLHVEYISDLGAGVYTFLKFLGGSNILLTQGKGLWSLLQMCESCI
jgi:hypothetical protein